MENIDTLLNIAHIHLDHAVFRVHVDNTDNYNIELMNESEKPAYINSVSRSADPNQSKSSLLVEVIDDYNLEEIANWVQSFNNKHP